MTTAIVCRQVQVIPQIPNWVIIQVKTGAAVRIFKVLLYWFIFTIVI